jgi:hypothetical protein
VIRTTFTVRVVWTGRVGRFRSVLTIGAAAGLVPVLDMVPSNGMRVFARMRQSWLVAVGVFHAYLRAKKRALKREPEIIKRVGFLVTNPHNS